MKYEIDGINYDVIIQKKKIKNIYIRFKDNKIYINIPFFTMKNDINNVLNKNIDSIRRMMKRDKKKNDSLFLGEEINVVGVSNIEYPLYSKGKLYVKDRNKLDDAYRFLAKSIFTERLDYIYKMFKDNIPYPTLKIRKMTSRWGVCNRKNNSITLNLELIKWNIECIDYVIVHELSHFIHFDHSKLFWKTVESYYPNYKAIRKKLRE